MDVKRQVKWMSGAVLSILFAVTMPVQADTSKKKTMIIAGPIGKSSSASARITLVIPPRPDKAKPSASQKKESDQSVDKKTQK
ncbi:hypothetical protein GZ77_18905 [Endozoicomonas montiporae]|uniref:Uncharacterized protein n=2 Tax=Endozoicomonas montiporae TaxID=1027273 RepID=A0A081N2A5_9GAMM|nr:hypothetical protein [Endozoicomonas montiporae]AMO58461.1 hypothetical protein EZMO1_4549 [Endozoicomonas montiporae CL-33]KEQ12578.1 hypothetical protein GZ77_18905 [Endozoicomonas montiporae]